MTEDPYTVRVNAANMHNFLLISVLTRKDESAHILDEGRNIYIYEPALFNFSALHKV